MPVVLNPGDDINAATLANPAGTTFLLNPGIYRQQSITAKAGNTYTTNVSGQMPIINGSKILTGWVFDGTNFFVTGQTQTNGTNGFCLPGFARCVRPEDVYRDHVPLRQAESLATLASGGMFFDYVAQIIYVRDDPTGHLMETGVTPKALGGSVNNVTVSNIIFEKHNNAAQSGAIECGSACVNDAVGWMIVNCEFRLNHGIGVRTNGTNHSIINCSIHDNGQMGTAQCGAGVANGNNLLQNCHIYNNNYAHFDPGWEAGGTKFVQMNGHIVKGCYSHNNLGPGLWHDIDNTNVTYDSNRSEKNTMGPGIMYEISCNATLKNNIIRNNLSSSGSFFMGQIYISTSYNVEGFGNCIVVPDDPSNLTHGIAMVQQSRGNNGPGCGTNVTTGNNFHNNTIVHLGNNGTNGGSADFNWAAMSAGNNRFTSNTYHVPDVTLLRWHWQDDSPQYGTSYNFTAWQATTASHIGQDVAGTADTVVSAITCDWNPPWDDYDWNSFFGVALPKGDEGEWAVQTLFPPPPAPPILVAPVSSEEIVAQTDFSLVSFDN